ncbi:MAG: methylenetetrahydrofolate--tRNA-(uracil(54)-C(5))-methyltransferase (FADH(2)-oxidizing) TrmFO [Alphaproteobacteria bacterium]|nr:methylenetetrahydrofolate--tRNA-(uracil(54)-C(5))-methyltransferase (FADH(2)-oxidizing) TrmFO [Alphaproteobacteria bacterium]
MTSKVKIIGGGLAGCEAAWQLVNKGIAVTIYEMRPQKPTPAHETENLAELVCSNSFRSSDAEHNAVGLMHEEMRICGSLIIECADANKVPAGGALAVDREGFSLAVQKKLEEHPLVEIVMEEVTDIPNDGEPVIIASGPLTSDALAEQILKLTGEEHLHFFDALAPIVYKDTIDFSKAWYQSRYDKGDSKDYINCPLTEDQYYTFIDALIEGEKIEFHEWEDKAKYFDGCLPIEVMAERGRDTLAFGPMKPVGLTNSNDPENKPFAVIQLRQDNKQDTLRNIVGFQTKLKHSEQKRIFRTIPGLEKAEFARLGGIHHNTFINSPILLDGYLRLKTQPNIMFAGQVTGCEGYVESASIGLLAGRMLGEILNGEEPSTPPATTAMGALLSYVISGVAHVNEDNFQPMNVNFGLFPTAPVQITPNGKKRKLRGKDRKKFYTSRAIEDLKWWLGLQ